LKSVKSKLLKKKYVQKYIKKKKIILTPNL